MGACQEDANCALCAVACECIRTDDRGETSCKDVQPTRALGRDSPPRSRGSAGRSCKVRLLTSTNGWRYGRCTTAKEACSKGSGIRDRAGVRQDEDSRSPPGFSEVRNFRRSSAGRRAGGRNLRDRRRLPRVRRSAAAAQRFHIRGLLTETGGYSCGEAGCQAR